MLICTCNEQKQWCKKPRLLALCVNKKDATIFLAHNFTKCWPIISWWNSAVYLQCSYYQRCHYIVTVSLLNLVKYMTNFWIPNSQWPDYFAPSSRVNYMTVYVYQLIIKLNVYRNQLNNYVEILITGSQKSQSYKDNGLMGWCGGATVGRRTLDREVKGSIPGRGVAA